MSLDESLRSIRARLVRGAHQCFLFLCHFFAFVGGRPPQVCPAGTEHSSRGGLSLPPTNSGFENSPRHKCRSIESVHFVRLYGAYLQIIVFTPISGAFFDTLSTFQLMSHPTCGTDRRLLVYPVSLFVFLP